MPYSQGRATGRVVSNDAASLERDAERLGHQCLGVARPDAPCGVAVDRRGVALVDAAERGRIVERPRDQLGVGRLLHARLLPAAGPRFTDRRVSCERPGPCATCGYVAANRPRTG